ncbi:hypothetical protein [Spiroplasma monobiae]|uniref:MOLPALP family lipoprotein n=1 Tax=Spiroplasma monobiae MQ-1 TaxID=1336748 RepID=A0A2K9LUH9_SPISQ|nr:hypothetical protein [Spiroplasma monobiae]AUM62708.1 hypothetical protein SMONO_v1c04590 [Spiroplasma monobiae MQ-1]
MKKLLSLLGAVTISASTLGSVAACGNKPTNDPTQPSKEIDFESVERQDTISKLMSQYAKTLYINQTELSDKETHFSSKYMMENKVNGEYLKNLGLTDFDISEEVEDNYKFRDVAKKYFDVNQILSSDLKISDEIYQDSVLDPSVKEEGIVETIKTTLPTILGMFSDPSSLQGLLGIVASNPGMIEQIISPEIIQTLGKVLTTEKLQLLENAFSSDVYKEMDYQTALDSSVIGLSNALDKFVNRTDSKWWLDSDSKSMIDENYDEATKSLADNIKKLMDKEAELKLDLIEDIDAIAEVIRFARTLLAYLDQFSYEEMTSELLTLAKIEEKRTLNFSSNSIDVKETFRKLEFMVNNDTTGVVLKNFVGALFSTNSTNFVKDIDFNENVNGGLVDVVQKIARKAMGADYIDASILGKLYFNTVIRSFLNSGLGNENGGKMIGLVNSLLFGFTSMLPDTIKPFIDAIKNNKDTEKFKNDWMGYLWNNSNEKLGFSLRNLLTKPIKDISLESSKFSFKKYNDGNRFNQPKSRGAEFLTKKTIKEIVDEFSSSFSTISSSKVNFDEIAELIARLKRDDTLQKALNNPSEMLFIFGYNEDGSLKDGSVLEQFFKFLNETKELNEKTGELLSIWIDEENKRISDLEIEAEELFKSIKVSIKRNSINDFEYNITDGNIKKIFNIKLKYNKNKTKLLVSEISLVK